MTCMPQDPWPLGPSAYPLDHPFTHAQARDCGLTPRSLASLVAGGLLVHPLHGVYHAAHLEDCLDLRLRCLRLVVPPDAVVTDRTAAWLLGADMALAPGDHLVVPKVAMFRPPGLRLRGKLVHSGERTLRADEVMEVGGLRVTTPLRTTCDLGRRLHRYQAIGAMDAMMRLAGFSVAQLEKQLRRYPGYRGIIQARELAPKVDPRSQSGPESTLRLQWLDCEDLPVPEPQVEVPGPHGSYFLDLGVPGLKYAAEYDGVEWHGAERRAHDASRREWGREQHGYIIDVFVAENIHGPHRDAHRLLRAGIDRARRKRGDT